MTQRIRNIDTGGEIAHRIHAQANSLTGSITLGRDLASLEQHMGYIRAMVNRWDHLTPQQKAQAR